jgi:hypothetical protein
VAVQFFCLVHPTTSPSNLGSRDLFGSRDPPDWRTGRIRSTAPTSVPTGWGEGLERKWRFEMIDRSTD